MIATTTYNCRTLSRSRGFTLIELMTALGVFAILIAVGAPGLRTFIEGNALITETNRVNGQLASVRMEAVKRNMQTMLCPSSNGTSCNASTWSSGWIAFNDANSDGKLATDGTEAVFAVGEAAKGNIRIAGNTALATAIRYKADGALQSDAGTVTICTVASGVSPNARVISMTTGGRTRVDSSTVTCQ